MEELTKKTKKKDPQSEAPVVAWLDLILKYGHLTKKPIKFGQIHPSGFEEYLERHDQVIRFKEKTIKKDLASFVAYLGKELDTRFPKREGKIPYTSLHLRAKKESPIYSSLQEFSLGLNLRSEPTSELQAFIRLVNFGNILTQENSYFCQAIQVEANNMAGGNFVLPKLIVNTFEEILTKYYKINSIEHKTSYTKDLENIRSKFSNKKL